ncbi:RHS repeat-associated core domain-containing protein [Cohnella fermenti]|nr:RHS repeat-associated core domain-containing protein [Cohnella fermenti]
MIKMANRILLVMLVISMLIPNLATAEERSLSATEIALDMAVEPSLDTPPSPIEHEIIAGEGNDNEEWQTTLDLIKDKATQNQKNRLHKALRYKYNYEDIVELLEAGASREDIYMSDLLGNEWIENPKELVWRKLQSFMSWEQLESELQQTKQERLKELLKKDSGSKSILDKKVKNLAEKIEVLESVREDGETLEDAINSISIEERSQAAIKTIRNSSDTSVTESIYSSVTDSVYEVAEDEGLSLSLQPLAFTSYAMDFNSYYNGLVTPMQINQANKPQFSDKNGTSEFIDPASGKVTWKETEISLPGRDGLDLNIGVIYQSNYGYEYQKTYGIAGNLKKENYLLSRYDLGKGWAFQFPSIQLAEGGYLYYHKGDGAVYQINFAAGTVPDSYTHLVGYQDKDIRMNQDTQGIFTNGETNSAYYLEYADKKREYFAADGRLLGMVDRFGNKITFQYIDRLLFNDNTGKVISSITDSLGRVVTFNYESTLRETSFVGEKIIVSVTDLNGVTSPKVTYTKWRDINTHNGVDDGYSPYLYIISNNVNSTYLNYNYYSPSKFSYIYAYDTSYSGWMTYAQLSLVSNMNTVTNYQYEKVLRRLGSSGFNEEYRAIARYDQVKRSGIASGDYNHINYSYTGDYTGYDAANPYYNPSSYTYSNTSTIQSSSLTNGLATTTIFNNLGQTTSLSTRASNGQKEVMTYSYNDATYKNLPTTIEKRFYDSDSDASPNFLMASKQYTDWGGLASETSYLTQEQYSNSTTKSQYTTTYTYDPVYYFLKTTSGYQSSNVVLTEQYDYFTNGRLKSYTNPKGETTTYCYDSIDSNVTLSNCTDTNVNPTGTITKIKSSLLLSDGRTSVNETLFTSATSYAYPSETRSYFTTKNGSGVEVTQMLQHFMSYNMGTGQLLSESDGNGDTTSYQYDAIGRPTIITYPNYTNASGVSYAVSDEITYGNYAIPTSADAENASVYALRVYTTRKYTQLSNNTVTYLSRQYDYYDGLGFLRYSQQYNNGTYLTSQYRSDDLSRAVYALDPMNNTTTVVYDVWGSQKEALDTYGNLYVADNRPKARKSIYYFVAAADVAAYRNDVTQNSLKSNYMEKEYDQWGRLLANKVYKDWPNTSTLLSELYTYDIAGNVVSYLDPKRNLNNEGVTTKYKYDQLNRLVELKDALGQITKYQYHTSGQVSSATVQESESAAPQTLSSKSFNEIGGLSAKTDAVGVQETSSYNSQGLLVQKLDRNGTTFDFQYDEQNRPILVTATSGSQTQQVKSIVGSSGILKDTQELYINGTKTASLTSTIDYLKRTTNIQITGANSFSSTLGITYDNNSRVTQYAVGGTSASFYTKYKYSGTRLDKVQTNGLTTANEADTVNARYTYYPNGQVWKITYPTLADGSILQTEYMYTSLNQIKSITNTKGSTTLSANNYTYDANGNIVNMIQSTINQPTKTSSYTYDKLNRLLTISRSDGSSASYSYDVRGNRLTLMDTNGSSIGIDDVSYEYDLNNTLVKATKNGVATTFDYAPDGLRYKKTTGTDVKQYRYNANGEVISEVNSSNAATANYVRGDRLLVKKDVAANKDYYYLYNGHGDVVQIVDTNGTVINSYDYDEWGNVVQQTEQIANVFKYAGEVFDSETGFYYLRARYYDPTIGRFINEDTYEGQITNPLSLNLYTYVLNNPLTSIDPTGHNPIAIGITIIRGLGAAIGVLSTISAGVAVGLSIPNSKSKEFSIPAPTSIADARVNRRPDQTITLYHATSLTSAEDILANGIDINRGRSNLDFGQGFYVTDNFQQAQDWVNNRFDGEGAILIFQVKEGIFNKYKGKIFKGASEGWRQFVYDNRNGNAVTKYDYVEGPYLANPQDSNNMDKYRAKGHQIAIMNTKLAIDVLKGFIGMYTMGLE